MIPQVRLKNINIENKKYYDEYAHIIDVVNVVNKNNQKLINNILVLNHKNHISKNKNKKFNNSNFTNFKKLKDTTTIINNNIKE